MSFDLWQRGIAESCVTARRELIFLSLSVVLLTPFVIGFTAFLAIFIIAYIGDDQWLEALELHSGSLATLGLLSLIGVVFRPRWDAIGWLCVGGALFCFAILAALCFLTELPRSDPTPFWMLFALLGTLQLALVGRLYSIQDRCVLGPPPSRPDAASTPQAKADALDLQQDFIFAIPALLFESYSQIFGSRWLWSGPSAQEITQALWSLLNFDRSRPGAAVRWLEEPASCKSE